MAHIVTDAAGRRLGVAGSIIDLAEPEPEPQVTITRLWPGFSRIQMPWRQIRIGHVRGNVTGADRIYTNGKVIEPTEQPGGLPEPGARPDLVRHRT
jgi:hypothetical protein